MKPELQSQMFEGVLNSLQTKLESSKTAHELSRTNLRAKLVELLGAALKQKDKVRHVLHDLSIFRELNEGYFENRSALHFCQLAKNIGFIEKSTI